MRGRRMCRGKNKRSRGRNVRDKGERKEVKQRVGRQGQKWIKDRLIAARFVICWHCTIDLKELPSRYKLEWCRIHVKFEGGDYPVSAYYHASTCRVHCKTLLSGRVPSPTSSTCELRHRCPVRHLVLLTLVSSREPSHGVLPIWIGKMTNWCSKWENWTENCQHLLDITKRHLLFPSICNCLSASWQQCCRKLRIEKYSSASNWFLTVREWWYVIGSSQAAVFDCPVLRSHSIELSGILFWDARSGTNTLQKLNFWGARQLSKKSPVSW